MSTFLFESAGGGSEGTADARCIIHRLICSIDFLPVVGCPDILLFILRKDAAQGKDVDLVDEKLRPGELGNRCQRPHQPQLRTEVLKHESWLDGLVHIIRVDLCGLVL